MTPLAIAFAIGGALWGLIADRIGARWPRHADGSVRAPGWRTAVTVVLSGAAMGALPARFTEPGPLAFFGAFFLALAVLLATDLDQRLLPNEITFPLIGVALVAAVTGWNPLVAGHLVSAILAATVIPALLFVVSVPFGAGAFGLGDVKLLVAVGLLTGLWQAGAGALFGILLAGVVLVALLAARRITLRTYVPYGPFLIVGAYWAVLVTV